MNMSFFEGVVGVFWNKIEVVVAQHVNVPNASNLFTLKRLILCAMNFNSSLSGRTETKSGSASVQAWACLHASRGLVPRREPRAQLHPMNPSGAGESLVLPPR